MHVPRSIPKIALASAALAGCALLASSLRSLKAREARLRALQDDRPKTERRRGGR